MKTKDDKLWMDTCRSIVDSHKWYKSDITSIKIDELDINVQELLTGGLSASQKKDARSSEVSKVKRSRYRDLFAELAKQNGGASASQSRDTESSDPTKDGESSEENKDGESTEQNKDAKGSGPIKAAKGSEQNQKAESVEDSKMQRSRFRDFFTSQAKRRGGPSASQNKDAEGPDNKEEEEEEEEGRQVRGHLQSGLLRQLTKTVLDLGPACNRNLYPAK